MALKGGNSMAVSVERPWLALDSIPGSFLNVGTERAISVIKRLRNKLSCLVRRLGPQYPGFKARFPATCDRLEFPTDLIRITCGSSFEPSNVKCLGFKRLKMIQINTYRP